MSSSTGYRNVVRIGADVRQNNEAVIKTVDDDPIMFSAIVEKSDNGAFALRTLKSLNDELGEPEPACQMAI